MTVSTSHQITSVQNAIWKQNLFTCWLTQIITMAAYQFLVPFIPFLIKEMGVRESRLDIISGIAMALPAFCTGLVAPFWGRMADIFGHKKMLIRATFFSSLLLFIFSFTTNIIPFLIMRALQGLLTGVIASTIALVSTSTPPALQNKALRMLSTAGSISRTIIPAISGFVVLAIGLLMAERVSSLFIFLVGILLCFVLKDPIKKDIRKHHHKQSKEITKSGKKISVCKEYHKKLLYLSFVIVGVSNLLIVSLIAIMTITILRFVPENKYEIGLGLFMGILGLWMLVSMYVVPLVISKIPKSRFSTLMCLCIFVIIICVILLVLKVYIGYVAYILLLIIGTSFASIVEVIMQEIIGLITYPQHRGIVFGYFTRIAGMSKFIGSLTITAINGWFGLGIVSLVVIAVYALVTLLCLYTRMQEKSTFAKTENEHTLTNYIGSMV